VTGRLKLVLAAMIGLYGLLVLFSSDVFHDLENEPPVTGVLPMTFAHKDHIEQNCILCHHNYNDDTGTGMCIDCHLRDPEVSHLLEEQFHGLCMTCHAEKYMEGEKGGPLRRCIDCHEEDHLP
jgi:hypothetical protein